MLALTLKTGTSREGSVVDKKVDWQVDREEPHLQQQQPST
jgi:hypothetical protein